VIKTQFKKISFNSRQYKIAYKLSGTGSTTIFFMHGWACSKETFELAFANELMKNYTICTFDLVGFGESEKPSNFLYKLEDQAELCAMFINSFGCKSYVVVGHSMGGVIALMCPPHLRTTPVVTISAEGNTTKQDTSTFVKILCEYRHGASIVRTILFAMGLFSNNYRKMAYWSRQANSAAICNSVQSLDEWSKADRLTTLIESTDAHYIFAKNSARHKRALQLNVSNMHTIDNAGHFMMLDNPEQFYNVIDMIAGDP
jgi:pimeloyl-ACP methyl ester carboxylesterase